MKSLQITLFTLSLLFTISCAQKKEISKLKETSITKLDGSTIAAGDLTNKVKALMDSAQVHGLSLAVFNNNQIAYQQSFGFKRADLRESLNDSTNIYGASLSKAVFGVLVMQLVEEGKLHLDTPLENYLEKPIYAYTPLARWHDDFLDLKTDTLYHKITARMCLNHTTGFPNWRWYQEDKKLKVLAAPGSRYRYSGEGFTYLQVVIEKMLGKNLEELAQERVFKPLGMHHSSYEWKEAYEDNFAYGHMRNGDIYQKDKDNEPRGASTLETTLSDYSTFMEALLQQKLLKPASHEELFRSTIRIRSIRQFNELSEKDSTLNDDIALGYGIGWGILQSPHGVGAFKEGHGDGFQHYSILYPEAGIGILMMANSDNGESIFKELLEFSIADTYSPTEWNGYIPYQELAAVPDSL